MAISTTGASEIPTMGMSAVVAYDHFVFEYTSRAGCGLLLPRIAYSQNGDLQIAISAPGASKIHTMCMSSVDAYDHFVFENTSRAGCGLLLPRIAYSQIGTSKWRYQPPGPPRFAL